MTDLDPRPASPPTAGQRIDQLVADLPKLERAVQAAGEAYVRAKDRHREALDELVDLVGRPTAARMLSLTPRELAGMLRARTTGGLE